ncbi:hypothetical protein KP509_26G017800 [Ceratopteris richardii]|nr:hypothetical protein KP509_26G017800 [Ceratopteris richardii]
MYAKCGDLAIAKKVFEELPAKGVVAWTTLITGYVQHNHDREAITCFKQMNDEGVFPNAMTLASVLKACGNLGAMKEGEEIHDIAVQHGLVKEDDRALCNALVDMYVKCGALTKARKLLDELPDRDVVCWALLIAGYIRQGHSRDAFDCFEEMLQHRLTPNEVIMSSILSVCSHLGLIEEGQMYFENMVPKYGIKPNVEHYMCMIDLYGRSGLLDKAVALIKSMPACENSVVWHTLLGACQKWRDVNTGRWAFDQAIQLDEMDNSAYVLMANVYIAAGLQEEADHIENLRLSVKTK